MHEFVVEMTLTLNGVFQSTTEQRKIHTKTKKKPKQGQQSAKIFINI